MLTIPQWFGEDEEWERPAPTRSQRRHDIQLALLAAGVAALGAELMRSLGAFTDERFGIGWQYAAMLSAAALVAVRRSHPVIVTIGAGVHMVTLSFVLPMTVSTLPMQAVYFFVILSGVAWAGDRRALVAALALVLTLIIGWVAWTFALGRALTEMRSMMSEDELSGVGLLSPEVAMVGLVVFMNLLYFGGAIILGQMAWSGAHRTAQVVQQAATIEQQSAQLRDQAVVAERLRIARELHDVVAHHVSIMGVQAAAARRVLDRDLEAARSSLNSVEQASRSAVAQMRDLLGTLRADPATATAGDEEAMPDRSPQPTLADLPALVAQSSTDSCEVRLDLVAADGAAVRVPPPVQLSTYRVVQEALANVHRHSTARHARAVVRIDETRGTIEVEVLDDGLPRPGSSGTGLGLKGMRERAEHLGGSLEVGPRAGSSGWRARIWFPLDGRPADPLHRSSDGDGRATGIGQRSSEGNASGAAPGSRMAG